MGLDFANLDDVTRAEMLEELEYDLHRDALYVSPRLSDQGQLEYAELLRRAFADGDDDRLAADLSANGRLKEFEFARNPRGGPDIQKRVPLTASQTLAEGEFNRFYARGLCRRAIALSDAPIVVVYRARESAKPRSESQALIGQVLPAAALLDDLRSNIGVDTALRLPPGPNSGLSVRLP